MFVRPGVNISAFFGGQGIENERLVGWLKGVAYMFEELKSWNADTSRLLAAGRSGEAVGALNKDK